MANRIQLRRDTAANWTSSNPTLAAGELGLETDTNKIKFGDGATAWASLAYYQFTLAGVTATGTDTYAATYAPSPGAYATGQVFSIIFTNANTGAATLNLNSLGAKSIKKNVSEALAAGDIAAGQAVTLIYDGTNFQVISGGESGSAEMEFNQQIDSYALVLADAFKTVEINKATAVNLTVPANADVAFPTGTIIYLKRTGAGAMTIVQGTGVTVTPTAGVLTDAGQNIEMKLTKTGTNTWSLQNGSSAGLWTDWVPTFTGFSVPPSNVIARYTVIGKTCILAVNMGDGTSNSTLFALTAPFTAAQAGYSLWAYAKDGGTVLSAASRLSIQAGSNSISLTKVMNTATVWTPSGAKMAQFNLTYEIE